MNFRTNVARPARLRGALLVFALVTAVVTLPTPEASAQHAHPAAIEGTWSGLWQTSPEAEDPVTLTLRLGDDGRLTGELVDPGEVELGRLSFDPSDGSLTGECRSADTEAPAPCALTATISGNRLQGRLTYEGTTGTLKLVKWTFTPTLRGSILVD